RPDRLPDGSIVYDGLLVDVTDLRRAAPPDVEAMGRLVGGVAHDVKNLLTATSGLAELLLDDLSPGDSRWRSDLEEILDRTRLAAGLTRQLLALGRQQLPLHAEPLDLNAVITAAAPLLRSLLGTSVHLVVLPAPTAVPVLAEQTQIERVLMNLALNARDAMPEGGTLSIEAGVATGPAAGPSATLRVSDTGVGMAPDVQARLFEPLFTTKPPGRGTGLGLSIVHEIVEQAAGTIRVASRPGAGTTITITLPLAEAEPAEAMVEPVAVAV
ncbi:MAG TPA: ATP-binding protein, partial [Gemmatimonadaceae bacterium]|nr:ATP-binding protein [Gemmatimonadaceae bacterium]